MIICIYRIISEWNITIEETIIFQKESPTLFNIYVCVNILHSNVENATLSIKNLFQVLLEKRKNTFNVDNSSDLQNISYEEYQDQVNPEKRTEVEIADLLKTGFFFPNHPVLRKINDINISKEQFPCSKIYKKVSSLGAGVVFFYCVDHNKCIGFIILGKSESPKIITQFMLTRLENMPDVIIYDNCCNLCEYILNRIPKPFENTRFMVDGFHFESHNNCSNSFNTSDHPGITKTINTSLVEQKNAKLRFLKRTTPYLKYNTFAYKLIYAIMKINK